MGWWWWGWLLFAVTLPARADDADAFLRAHAAYLAHDSVAFERAASQVSPRYVLAPYLQFWRLSQNLGDDSAIADFLAVQHGTWLAQRLRALWLNDLGRRQMWPAYLAEYPKLADPTLSLRCYEYQAQLASGKAGVLTAARPLWFSADDLPSSCTPLFTAMADVGLLDRADIWQRLHLALLADHPEVARAVADYLGAEGIAVARMIERAQQSPAAYLAALGRQRGPGRGAREVALYALTRQALFDPQASANWLERHARGWPAHTRATAWAQVAVQAARQHDRAALGWFARAGTGVTSDYQKTWRARAALRAQDWSALANAIHALPSPMQAEPEWRYWLARAYQARGGTTAANRLYAGLARTPDYYGQLAGEELGVTLEAASPRDADPAPAAINAAANDPGIVRALTLWNLGLRFEATGEWNWAIRGFDDPQLLAAAELARQANWYDRAIYTAGKTHTLKNYKLLFPAPYREEAMRYASQYHLDPAWVYGLMRQESRFTLNARSAVGALGLMQIMPATARWIARRLGIEDFRASSAHDLDTNLRFGTYYLRYALDGLADQPVLATAGYNAGPLRARRWQADRPLDATIYIDTIPFQETRDYVKKVMNNAMFYARRFDTRDSPLLKARLGIIPPRP